MEAAQQQQTQQPHWQQVECREYRRLGDRLAALEALARGEDVAAPDRPPTPGAEPLTVGEQQATLKGQLLMLMRSLQASLQAVLDTRPQLREDCRMVEVVRVCGGEEVVEVEAVRMAEKARRN